MIDGIVLNIIAYTLMIIGAYFALDHSISHGTKLTQGINYVIMFWNIFMVIYLTKDYENILLQPLNVRLNFFEGITNYLLAFWLLSFKLKKTKK